MRTYSCDEAPQGGPVWHELHCARSTASSFNRVMMPKKRKLSSGAARYAAELASQAALALAGNPQAPTWMSESRNKPPNQWLDHGKEVEPEARRFYELETESFVQQVGFCLADGGIYGCSPDGLVYAGIGAGNHFPPLTLAKGLELKCPMAKTHADYLISEAVPLQHLCQVHGSMIVTGLRSWDWMSYAQGLQALLIPVIRDTFTDDLEECLEAFLVLYNLTCQKLLNKDLAEVMALLHPQHTETPHGLSHL